jgi:hypothetical protein
MSDLFACVTFFTGPITLSVISKIPSILVLTFSDIGQRDKTFNNETIKRPAILRLSAISYYCWFVNIGIGGTSCDMLIDTGSAVTII